MLIRFIGADEHIYANCGDTMQWLEEMDILDMIVDKFSSSVSYIRQQGIFMPMQQCYSQASGSS